MADYPASIPALTRVGNGVVGGADDPASDGSATDAVVVVTAIQGEVEAIAGELGTTPSGAAATVAARLDALDTTVSGKAASSHAHATGDVTGLAESVRDTIGATLVAGSNVTVTVDDAGDTITIASTAGGLTSEQVMDTVATMLTAGANITLTYNDAGDTLTVAVSGLGAAAALSLADIDERARDALGTALVAGSGITITPNDGADTITIASTGSGGTTWLSGSSVPADSTGSTDNYYIETTAWFNGTRVWGPKSSTTTRTVTNRAKRGQLAILTTSVAHGFTVGQAVTLSSVSAKYNGTWVIAGVPSVTTFEVVVSDTTDESSVASSGSAAQSWPKFQMLRRVPDAALVSSGTVNTSAPNWAFDGAMTQMPLSGAVGSPWAIAGTAGYVVYDGTSGYRGASTSGTAYALIAPGYNSIQTARFTVADAVTEAGGKAGIVLCGAGGVGDFGIEINVRNDNKLYIDRNIFGTVTNLWTSSTTAALGGVTVLRTGSLLMVVASAWGCDVRVDSGTTLAGGTALGLFFKNTSAGRITQVVLGGA